MKISALLNPHSIEISIVSNRADLHAFIAFPYRLYERDQNWVPPLRLSQRKLFSKANVFWAKNPHRFFLASKAGRCVGRIAAFVNVAHNAHLNAADGFFGFLESEEDPQVFAALLDAAAAFLSACKCRRIVGPMNPDIHNELGVLVHGFESPPFIMLTYNAPSYDALIQQQGFARHKDFFAYSMPTPANSTTRQMERVSSRLRAEHSLSLRSPDMKRFREELERFHKIYNDAFCDHWGFVPIPKDEFLLLAADMKSIIDPRMVLIVEHKGEPLAFLLCLPNINEILRRIRNGRLFPFGLLRILAGRKRISSLRVITAAVMKNYQHLGIGAMLYPEIMRRANAYGYTQAELSWIVEDNATMNALARKLAGEPSKVYRLYARTL